MMNKRTNINRPAPLRLDLIQQNQDKNQTSSNEFMEDFFSRPQFTDKLQLEDFTVMGELGSGNGGFVTKVRYIPSGQVLARKVIRIEVNPADRLRIMQEIGVLKHCNSPYIVGYFGACYGNGELNLFMEYMDGRSLDSILSKVHRIREDILGKVSVAVIQGLIYLRQTLNIMHRDIKPSNILVNSHGHIKLCDFGVSGQLINSIAQSFVGTNHYMAPERIQGQPYTVESDIWSLGLSLVELALGTYPIPQDDPLKMYETEHTSTRKDMPIFELMGYIVNETPPTIPPSIFTADFKDFIDRCLKKEPKERFDLRNVIEHPFVITSTSNPVNVELWVCQVWSGAATTPSRNPRVYN